jgi:Tc toxin complex TcA C-terminal TcB-binding domain
VQQVSRHVGTVLKLSESVVHLLAGIYFFIPNTGSPFAMTYGGRELDWSGAEFAQWTSSMAAVAEAVSASAGLEASFQRREQEWDQQLLLAEQELKQVEQQRLAAEVRALITDKDLKIHEQNMEHADELDEFYKNKFTNLGLYNYLSTTLTRLYREAYNVAYDLARMAERTYEFERDDKTIFIAADNWQFDRAGLLAGERLLLQLQRLEKAYLEQNTRDYEVTQSFSLALLNPSALLKLKQTGNCIFNWVFHMMLFACLHEDSQLLSYESACNSSAARSTKRQ